MCLLLLLLGGSAASADGPVTGPLTRTGQWVTDDQGRVVILHGVDIVRKTAPFYPNNFTEQDAAFLADEGFTMARIGFIWQGVEPQPGVYDDGYARNMASFNDLLARYGIRTLVDFHQDEWSSSAGGDGAPAWATLGTNFLDDFQDFWDNDPAPDGVGIQTHFVDAWRHVTPFLSDSVNVLGFDPFNEPYAGSDSACAPFTPCPSFESGALAAFYGRVIAAIRTADGRHVIFPEGIAQNGLAEPSLPHFGDSQTAFSFHYYCTTEQGTTSDSQADEQACAPLEQSGLGNFYSYAKQLDVPAVLGEFSDSDDDDYNAEIVDQVDQHFTSWAMWMYYAYSQDPGNSAAQGLLIDDSKPGSEANAKPAKLDAIVVPYPQAIAGTPETYAFDRSTDTMTLTYQADPVPGAQLAANARTQIFVPQRKYPHGYHVAVSGAEVVSGPAAPWVELVADHPGATVSVTITPATDSTTQLPIATGSFPLALQQYPSSAPSPTPAGAPAACKSRRVVLIHLLDLRAASVRRVTIYLNGHRDAVLRGALGAVRIDLSGRPRGTVRVRLVVLTRHGRTVISRRYRTCTAGHAP